MHAYKAKKKQTHFTVTAILQFGENGVRIFKWLIFG
jgi:hypothetical protein